jgi:hypothetical protein
MHSSAKPNRFAPAWHAHRLRRQIDASTVNLSQTQELGAAFAYRMIAAHVEGLPSGSVRRSMAMA